MIICYSDIRDTLLRAFPGNMLQYIHIYGYSVCEINKIAFANFLVLSNIIVILRTQWKFIILKLIIFYHQEIEYVQNKLKTFFNVNRQNRQRYRKHFLWPYYTFKKSKKNLKIFNLYLVHTQTSLCWESITEIEDQILQAASGLMILRIILWLNFIINMKLRRKIYIIIYCVINYS